MAQPKGSRKATLAKERFDEVDGLIALLDKVGSQITTSVKLEDALYRSASAGQATRLGGAKCRRRFVGADLQHARRPALPPDALLKYTAHVAKLEAAWASLEDVASGLTLPQKFHDATATAKREIHGVGLHRAARQDPEGADRQGAGQRRRHQLVDDVGEQACLAAQGRGCGARRGEGSRGCTAVGGADLILGRSDVADRGDPVRRRHDDCGDAPGDEPAAVDPAGDAEGGRGRLLGGAAGPRAQGRDRRRFERGREVQGAGGREGAPRDRGGDASHEVGERAAGRRSRGSKASARRRRRGHKRRFPRSRAVRSTCWPRACRSSRRAS